MKRYSNLNKAFTLIELLVVVAIIGILATVVLASLNGARLKARDARRISDLRQIRTALELFYNDNGFYPQSNCGWDCNGYRYSFNSSWDTLASDLAPYISTPPKDPINSSGDPFSGVNFYSYVYGNVGRVTNTAQYDLIARLEDPNNILRCEAKAWRYYFNNALALCPTSTGYQLYQATD